MTPTQSNKYLVTGGMGCLGAWVLYHLVKQGKQAVSFDRSADRSRLSMLLSPADQARVTFVESDITDFSAVLRVFEQHEITRVIHLAALQVPFCRKDPVLGSQVNVVGTVNIFQAAQVVNLRHIAYASSIAVYGRPEQYPPGAVTHDAPHIPQTLYGVYKVANEGTARVFWQEHQLSSTALRPYTVYGVGRDQGMTSGPTLAMQAAARGENFHISFGGTMQFHFASDVALQFIDAAETPTDGAYVFNLGTPPQTVAAVAGMIEQARPGVTITAGDARLPFPEAFDDTELRQHCQQVYETPLAAGIADTIRHFERLNRVMPR